MISRHSSWCQDGSLRHRTTPAGRMSANFGKIRVLSFPETLHVRGETFLRAVGFEANLSTATRRPWWASYLLNFRLPFSSRIAKVLATATDLSRGVSPVAKFSCSRFVISFRPSGSVGLRFRYPAENGVVYAWTLPQRTAGKTIDFNIRGTCSWRRLPVENLLYER